MDNNEKEIIDFLDFVKGKEFCVYSIDFYESKNEISFTVSLNEEDCEGYFTLNKEFFIQTFSRVSENLSPVLDINNYFIEIKHIVELEVIETDEEAYFIEYINEPSIFKRTVINNDNFNSLINDFFDCLIEYKKEELKSEHNNKKRLKELVSSNNCYSIRTNIEKDIETYDICYTVEYENEFGNSCVETFVFTSEHKDIDKHFNEEILGGDYE